MHRNSSKALLISSLLRFVSLAEERKREKAHVDDQMPGMSLHWMCDAQSHTHTHWCTGKSGLLFCQLSAVFACVDPMMMVMMMR